MAEAVIDIAPRHVADVIVGIVADPVTIVEELAAIPDRPRLQASLRPFHSLIFHALTRFG